MKNAIILFPLLLLVGCGILTTDQAAGIADVITQIEAQGALTPAQATALKQAVMMNTGDPWWMQLGRLALEVGLAIAGVRWWRGPSATSGERAARIAARVKP